MRVLSILFISFASLADAILTDFGIRLGSITEANPLMLWLYEKNEPAFFLLKILLPLMMLFVVPKQVIKPIQRLLFVTVGIYICVLSLHGFWLLEQYNAI